MKIVALIGPSGSGKTTIIDEIISEQEKGTVYPFGKFIKLKSTTSKDSRLEDYNKVSREEFEKMIANSEFVEYTNYSGNYYGVPKQTITDLGDGIGIKAFDIVGVKSFKRLYGDDVLAIFVYRKTDALIASILERNVTDAEKNARISQLEDEQKNRFSEEIDGILKVDENDLPATINRLMHLLEAVK